LSLERRWKEEGEEEKTEGNVPGVKTNLLFSEVLFGLALQKYIFLLFKAFFSKTIFLKKGNRKKVELHDILGGNNI
jgi:hypothetical protein